MVEAGAELLDVGGESTRPGAEPVDADEEIRRIAPVIEAIKRDLGVRVSVDTRNAAVARRAFDAGADMLNDVSALADPGTLPLLSERRAPVVLMHMRGLPETMQRDTRYDDVVASVVSFLRRRLERAVSGGIAGDTILVDPGIGFGKDVAGNLSILRRLTELRTLGCPIVIGASRKSFIGAVLDAPVGRRLEGSLAVAAFASAQGAHVVRAHDVAETVRVVRMIDAIRDAGAPAAR
jgi:dihydropteroate synthase